MNVIYSSTSYVFFIISVQHTANNFWLYEPNNLSAEGDYWHIE